MSKSSNKTNGKKRKFNPRHKHVKLARNVYLIGFMGAGKSSVARRVARSCGVSALDVDTFIERSQDKRVSEIFAEGGEQLFRQIEADTMKELADRQDSFIFSCGGGVITTQENIDTMRNSGVVVYLSVDADEAAARISDTSSRPLFKDIEAARSLCEERRPVYEAAANHVIDTSGKHVSQIARELIEYLKREEILCQQHES